MTDYSELKITALVQGLARLPPHKKTQEEQVAQLSQRENAAGWVNFGQRWKMTFYRYLQPLQRNQPPKLLNFVK